MFSFQWPWIFLLVILPLIVYRYVPPRQVQKNAIKVPFFNELTAISTPQLQNIKPRKIIFLLAIWLLLLSAAAKPLWLGEPQPLTTSSRDLMLAVDISGSMETKDMQLGSQMVDRLTGIKVVLDGFIQRRSQDRIGLILFADNAYIQTPLTLDHRSLTTFLTEAQIGFAGRATAIGDAIGLAIKRMQNSVDKSKVLVILTDGANTAGAVTPLDAAQVAAKNGLKIYTLGFGADEMNVENFFGSRRVNPSADLDEQSLKQIASLTNGKYFRARSIDELVEIYQLLDALEPQPVEGKVVVPQQSLFYWPLALAVWLALCWMAVFLVRNRQQPKKSQPSLGAPDV